MRYMRHMLIVLSGVFVTSLFISPATGLAQKSPGAPGTSGTSRLDSLLIREADLETRDFQLRLLGEPAKNGAPLSADARKLIVSQIFEDFEHIQVVNREMMKASSNLDRPAYKQISTLADELNKRAKRLKTNLGIPDLNDEKKDTEQVLVTDAPQLKASLVTLNGSVKSFVANPLFKEPRVTDVRHLTNLRRDISNIIELSHVVKKGAGKLHH